MKQLVQDFKTGELKVVEVPPPAVGPGKVLVRNAFSLVSAGTERSTVEMGQASLLGKARQRPDLAKQVLNTLKREGLQATLNKVRSRLDQWKALGYACAGVVVEVGEGVTDIAPGDRVACGGQDRASHAEMVAVPRNLCAKVPEGVPLEHAAFTTLGAIALHGIRQADVRLGETVAVLGLGLVGQLTVQLLRAAGCQVVGWDPQPEACALAGVKPGEPDSADAVIITAATDSSEPLETAAQLCRDRGRVVLVGRTGTEIPREVFYRKELEFRVSRSYGPGRYDPVYEDKGVDYPIGYVRWTEQRNMEAFLRLLADGRINVAPLITHVFSIEDGLKAYDLITGKTSERFVGVLLKYAECGSGLSAARVGTPKPTSRSESAVVLGVIGAGNYAQGVLLPLFKANKDVTLHTVCTATGVKAEKAREKFGFQVATTDWRAVVADEKINTVLVATRHNLHAEIVCAALRAGKTVFCEKPLCLRADELTEIERALAQNDRLMVGFNRRFAPFAAQALRLTPPLVIRYRVSVQPLPKDSWYLDPDVGGGRILGEVCHFVDFLQFAARSRPLRVYAQGFGASNVQVSLRFANDSVGAVEYFEVADASLPKEHVELYGGGQHLVITDFRDKGHAEEVRRFVEAVKTGGPMPIPLEEILAATRGTLAIKHSLGSGEVIVL